MPDEVVRHGWVYALCANCGEPTTWTVHDDGHPCCCGCAVSLYLAVDNTGKGRGAPPTPERLAVLRETLASSAEGDQ